LIINKIRDEDGDFDFSDLHKETIVTGYFNGNLFQPNVRYEVDIRDIIPEIKKVIKDTMSRKTYTHYYGPVELVRHNILSNDDYYKV